MLSDDQLQQAIGSTAYGSNGEKIGKVGQIYLDDSTGQPEWATLNTGLLGTSESFVPLSDASFSGDRLTLSYTKEKVKDSPNVSDSDGHLTPEQERELYEYYGMSYSEAGTDYDTTRTTGESGDAMTLSEERVNVGTRSEETGRARLRKYVETDQVQESVPVRKERAVVEREPITDANIGDATSGPDISEDEHEVTLHEERPVVEKTVEPVERVRLGKEEVTSEETVSEEVRKERVEADGDVTDRDLNR